MPLSQGSRTRLSYVVESTFGTTPGSPTMLEIPINTHTLNKGVTRVQGNEIRSDRMPRYDRHGQITAGGDIVVDFRDSDYDDFIESAFMSSINSSGTMKVGTTLKHMSIEDALIDVSRFRQFTGMTVSQMAMTVVPDQMVQATFTLVGDDMSLATSTLGSPSAPSGANPMDSYDGNTVMTLNGSAVTATSFSWSINNDMTPAYAIGDQTAQQLEYGMAVVEGEVTVYMEDSVVTNLFLNETEFAIVSAVSDGTNTYTFTFPRCKANGADTPLANPKSRLVTLPFVALYDATAQTNLTLVKS